MHCYNEVVERSVIGAIIRTLLIGCAVARMWDLVEEKCKFRKFHICEEEEKTYKPVCSALLMLES